MITAQQGPLGNTLQIWMEDDNAPLVLARTATKVPKHVLLRRRIVPVLCAERETGWAAVVTNDGCRL